MQVDKVKDIEQTVNVSVEVPITFIKPIYLCCVV